MPSSPVSLPRLIWDTIACRREFDGQAIADAIRRTPAWSLVHVLTGILRSRPAAHVGRLLKKDLHPLGYLAAAILLLVGSGLVPRETFRSFRQTQEPADETFETVVPVVTNVHGHSIAVAPDGQFVVYVGTTGQSRNLYLHRFSAQGDQRLLTTDDTVPSSPFVSLDSQSIGFIDGSNLMMVPVSGGSPALICECRADPRGGAAWLPDGSIVFRAGNHLRVFDATTRRARDLTREQQGRRHTAPAVLRDTSQILFTVLDTNGAPRSIDTVDLHSGVRRVVTREGQFARQAGSRRLAYLDRTLAARITRFDADTLEFAGSALQSAAPVVRVGDDGSREFDVSRDGTLVYLPGGAPSSLRTLAWVSRDGSEAMTPFPPKGYTYPRISPDGTTIAVDVREPSPRLWVSDPEARVLAQVDPDNRTSNPVWASDGRSLLHVTGRNNRDAIATVPVPQGGQSPVVRTTYRDPLVPYALSPGGTTLLARSGRGRYTLNLVPLVASPVLVALSTEPVDARNGDFSPDAKWAVYQSQQSGRKEVYVRSLTDLARPLEQISTGGGTDPVWSRTGTEIVYLGLDKRLMRVPVSTKDGFTHGRADPVLPASYSTHRWFTDSVGRTFDMTPDGSRFLFVKLPEVEGATFTRVHVIRHWTGEE